MSGSQAFRSLLCPLAIFFSRVSQPKLLKNRDWFGIHNVPTYDAIKVVISSPLQIHSQLFLIFKKCVNPCSWQLNSHISVHFAEKGVIDYLKGLFVLLSPHNLAKIPGRPVFFGWTWILISHWASKAVFLCRAVYLSRVVGVCIRSDAMSLR